MLLSSATLLSVGLHSLLFNIVFLLLDLMFSLFLTPSCLPTVLTSDFLHESNVSFRIRGHFRGLPENVSQPPTSAHGNPRSISTPKLILLK